MLNDYAEEGFKVSFVPFERGGHEYMDRLAHLADDLERGEQYGVVAFGKAAAACLTFFADAQPHMVVLVAYYPSAIADPRAQYSAKLEIACHLTASQGFAPAFRAYFYDDVEPGFAEQDLDEYDKIAAALAWSRTIGALRRAFGMHANLEKVLDERATGLQSTCRVADVDVRGEVGSMLPDAHVTYVPTMTGGMGQQELFVFYQDYFVPDSPPSLRVKLISRTIGIDRVVDEMVVSFKHTQEMSWILPGVSPTHRDVRVAVVSIVGVRGGRLFHEHVYWDQASVLVQVGLLDPTSVPDAFRANGLKRLPVFASEPAAKVSDEESHPSNVLISDWKHRLNGD